MRIIARKALKEFWERHPDSEQALRSWFKDVSVSRWSGPVDIKRRYPSASFLSDNRVVFNIKGNNYRLVVHIRYDLGRVYIRFLGTHAEYDNVDARTV